MGLASQIFAGLSASGPNVIFSIAGPSGANAVCINPSLSTTVFNAGLTLNGTLTLNNSPSNIVFKGAVIEDATTLTAAQSGTYFAVYLTAPSFTITLPTPTAGLNYKFFVDETSPPDIALITGPAGSLIGTVTQPSDVLLIGTATTLTFTGDANLGDLIEVYGNGTSWVCKAVSGENGGIVIVP